MFKKILIGLLVLVVLAGGGLYYVWSNLDHYIKVAIEKYGSAATQTDVKLDSVDLSLSSGQGSLSGLSIDNPKGFNTSLKAFYLGNIKVDVDINSIRGTGPIIIKTVVIDKPQVNYEITSSGDSNLSKLQSNAQSYASSMGGSTGGTAPHSTTDKTGGRKIVIDDLVVRNGQMGIGVQMVENKSFSAPLPEIHLTNIGKKSGGTTAAEVTQQILSAITASAGQVAATDIAKNLGGLKDMIPLKGATGDSLSNVGNQVKGLLGQ